MKREELIQLIKELTDVAETVSELRTENRMLREQNKSLQNQNNILIKAMLESPEKSAKIKPFEKDLGIADGYSVEEKQEKIKSVSNEEVTKIREYDNERAFVSFFVAFHTKTQFNSNTNDLIKQAIEVYYTFKDRYPIP